MDLLVVGATGVLGQQVTRRLVESGHHVRAMTRNVRASHSLSKLGAQPVIADLIDRRSLERACAGVDRVFAAAHGALGRGRYRSEAVDDDGHQGLIDAARAAGIARFVYTSAFGSSPDHPVDFFRTKWRIEQYLAQSGIPHVILRPSAFMEWHAHVFNGKALLEKGRALILGRGTKKRNFVAAKDVAALASNALLDEPLRERVLPFGGPGDFSDNDVAAMYARIARIPLRVSHVPVPLLAAMSVFVRPVHPGVARVMRLASLPDDAFPATLNTDDAARDYQIVRTSLEQFVTERVAAHQLRG